MYRVEGSGLELVATALTNSDGRCDAPLLEGDTYRSGVYQVQFSAGDYYRAREMRNGMLLTVAMLLPFAWALQPYGNHGLWITFLLFMALRSLTLWAIVWRLNRQNQWLG